MRQARGPPVPAHHRPNSASGPEAGQTWRSTEARPQSQAQELCFEACLPETLDMTIVVTIYVQPSKPSKDRFIKELYLLELYLLVTIVALFMIRSKARTSYA